MRVEAVVLAGVALVEDREAAGAVVHRPAVTGTAEHNYDGWSLKRTYNVTGTQTSTGLMLTGTGSWYPSSFSAVPWTVNFNFSTTK